jgi:hypothetical protein
MPPEESMARTLGRIAELLVAKGLSDPESTPADPSCAIPIGV